MADLIAGFKTTAVNSGGQSPKLLDQMRSVLRVQRYALRTERAYCDWVRRFVKFHQMRCREDLAEGTRKVEAFLTHLAVEGQVAPSTQNQALNALLFLYERVLEQPLTERVRVKGFASRGFGI